MFFLRLTACLLAAFIFTSSAIAQTSGNLLTDPTSTQQLALYYAHADQKPDYESYAQKSYQYKKAGEFDKQSVKQSVINEFKNEIEAMKKYDEFVLTTRIKLPQYNGEKGGFYLPDVSRTKYFRIGGRDEIAQIKVPVHNVEEFRFWSIAPDRAKQLLADRASYERYFNLKWHLKIDRAGPAIRSYYEPKKAYSNRLALDTHLVSLSIEDEQSGEVVDVLKPQTQFNPLELSRGKDKNLTSENLNINGFELGMSPKEVRKMINKLGYERGKVYLHKYEKPEHVGLDHDMDPYNTESVRVNVTQPNCKSVKKEAASFCPRSKEFFVIEFTKGEDKFLGGQKSEVHKITYSENFSGDESSITENYDHVLEAFGRPDTIYYNKIEGYGWVPAPSNPDWYMLQAFTSLVKAGSSPMTFVGEELNGTFQLTLVLSRPKETSKTTNSSTAAPSAPEDSSDGHLGGGSLFGG